MLVAELLPPASVVCPHYPKRVGKPFLLAVKALARDKRAFNRPRSRRSARRLQGVLFCAIALVFACFFVYYVIENAHLLTLKIKKQASWAGSLEKTAGPLYIGSVFFHKLGIFSFVFCWLFFALGVNIFCRRRVFFFRKHLKYGLLIFGYGILAFGFLTPRFAFPYSGSWGKRVAAVCVDSFGFWVTFLLIFVAVPVMIYRVFLYKSRPTRLKRSE